MSLLLLFNQETESALAGAKFAEPILTQIETLLKRDMATKIAEINSEYSDSAVLTEPRSDAYYWGNVDFLRGLPAICIFSIDSIGEIYDNLSVRTDHTIAVKITVKHNVQLIVKLVLRYLRAITEILCATTQLELAVDQCKYAGHEYMPISEMENGWYVYSGIALFSIDATDQVRT